MAARPSIWSAMSGALTVASKWRAAASLCFPRVGMRFVSAAAIWPRVCLASSSGCPFSCGPACAPVWAKASLPFGSPTGPGASSRSCIISADRRTLVVPPRAAASSSRSWRFASRGCAWRRPLASSSVASSVQQRPARVASFSSRAAPRGDFFALGAAGSALAQDRRGAAGASGQTAGGGPRRLAYHGEIHDEASPSPHAEAWESQGPTALRPLQTPVPHWGAHAPWSHPWPVAPREAWAAGDGPPAMMGVGPLLGTTILCVRKGDKVCIAGDGMVSQGNMVGSPSETLGRTCKLVESADRPTRHASASFPWSFCFFCCPLFLETHLGSAWLLFDAVCLKFRLYFCGLGLP
eukprot:GHVT01088173.1.p1 GENE.GHVT01088173.1~~GHVT01088173.1.p1  ORF type:complete len:363 (-),score=54.82 GHVT01088173.1:148-1200(-)